MSQQYLKRFGKRWNWKIGKNLTNTSIDIDSLLEKLETWMSAFYGLRIAGCIDSDRIANSDPSVHQRFDPSQDQISKQDGKKTSGQHKRQRAREAWSTNPTLMGDGSIPYMQTVFKYVNKSHECPTNVKQHARARNADYPIKCKLHLKASDNGWISQENEFSKCVDAIKHSQVGILEVTDNGKPLCDAEILEVNACIFFFNLTVLCFGYFEFFIEAIQSKM